MVDNIASRFLTSLYVGKIKTVCQRDVECTSSDEFSWKVKVTGQKQVRYQVYLYTMLDRVNCSPFTYYIPYRLTAVRHYCSLTLTLPRVTRLAYRTMPYRTVLSRPVLLSCAPRCWSHSSRTTATYCAPSEGLPGKDGLTCPVVGALNAQ